jgi:hypothetical protein
MVLSYLVLAVEAAAFGFLPYFLGKAVDGLFVGDVVRFQNYVLVCMGTCLVGCLRRVFDTRVFGMAWASVSSSAVRRMMGRGMESSRVVVRAGLSSKFVDFFEYGLPQLGRAVVGVSVALSMLWRSERSSAVIAIVLFIVSMIASARISKARRRWDDVAVGADDARNAAIEAGEPAVVDAAYGDKARAYIGSSDLSALDWIQGVGFGMAAEAVVIFGLAGPGTTPGAVVEVVGYVWGIFGYAGSVSGFLDILRGVGVARDKIEEV